MYVYKRIFIYIKEYIYKKGLTQQEREGEFFVHIGLITCYVCFNDHDAMLYVYYML